MSLKIFADWQQNFKLKGKVLNTTEKSSLATQILNDFNRNTIQNVVREDTYFQYDKGEVCFNNKLIHW